MKHWSRREEVVVGAMLTMETCAFLFSYLTIVPSLSRALSPHALVMPPAQHPLWFLAWFGVATMVVLVVVTHIRHEYFFSLLFYSAIGVGLLMTFLAPLLQILPFPLALLSATLLAILFLLLRIARPTVGMHNFIILLATIGIARFFGMQFIPEHVLFILSILALYDIVAVFFSRHMIVMARTLVDHHVFLGFILPTRFRDWNTTLARITMKDDTMMVGAGDIALPLFFGIAMLLTYGSVAFSVVYVFTLLGLVIIVVLARGLFRHRPFPALPPLVVCLFLGYQLVRFLFL